MKDKINNMFPAENDIPQEYRIDKLIEQKEYLVNGKIKKWNGLYQEVFSPIYIKDGDKLTRKKLGYYPMLGEKEAVEILDAAVNAYNNGAGKWPTMTVEDRIKHVLDFTNRMKEKRDEIVNLLMWEIGKSYKSSCKEFDRTIEYILDTVESLKDLDRKSSRFEIENNIIAQIRRAPLGIVLCMGPFNYPLNETFTTLIPAVIMGNTVIFKPAKYGVLLNEPLLEAFKESFPPGVINTIYGDGRTVIGPLMASGKINVLAFIGSCKVANILKKQHPMPNRLRSVLGLGAKNAAIVLEDADLEHTVNECLLGTLSYNGQRCTALKILFVHKNIVNDFIKKYNEGLKTLKSGMPWEENVNLTPLPEDNKVDWLNEYVEDAKKNGAEVVNENGGLYNDSFFYPAVLYPVNDKMKIYHEEQFGPVIPIVSFDNIDEPMNYIINSQYGQQASIFGKDPDKISDLIDPIVNQVCRLNINSQSQRGPDVFPFTARKDSAEGTLSVSDALRVFTIRTLVAAKGTQLNKKIITKIIRERKSNFLDTDFIL